MDSMNRTFLPFAVLAFMAAACGPPEDRTDATLWDDDPAVGADAAPRTDAQFASFRFEVDSLLNELRSDVAALTEEATVDRDDDLEDVSARLGETHDEIRSDLDRMATADRDEARDIRERTSERLAELEADVVRAELKTVADPQTLQTRAEERLSQLEEDIRTIEQQRTQTTDPANGDMDRNGDRNEQQGMTTRDRNDQDATNGWDLFNGRSVEDLREELEEARREAARAPTAQMDDDFRDLRDSLGDQIADLTRDVREHLYNVRWRTENN